MSDLKSVLSGTGVKKAVYAAFFYIVGGFRKL